MLDPSTGRTQIRPGVGDYEQQGASYPLQYNTPYAPPPGPPPRAKDVGSTEDVGLGGAYAGYEPPTLGYEAGMGKGFGADSTDKEDPFADFDEPVNGARSKVPSESRDTLV